MNVDVLPSARRQVYELTPSDLATVPVWEFALDEESIHGQDEATVRPYMKAPVDPGDGLQVVRAKFDLADGTELLGFVSPPPPTASWEISQTQPTIVLDKGHVRLWFGIFQPTPEQVSNLLATFGKAASEVFPLTYRSDVEIIGGPVEGTVAGFSFMRGGRIDTV